MAARFGPAQLMLAPLLRRKSRALLSLCALTLGACLVTSLLTLYRGVQQNLGRQFRRYGANLVVTPPAGTVRLSAAAAQPALALFPDSVGVLYDVAQAGPAGGGAALQSLVVAGADLTQLRAMNTEWQVAGPLPQGGEAWLGVNAARHLNVKAGDSIQVTLDGRGARWRVAGTVQSGTSEDNQILAPYAQVATLAAADGYTTLQFRIVPDPSSMQAAVVALRHALPGAAVNPVRQIAAGEGAVLLSTRSMLMAATGLILFTVGLCVAAALTTLALERRRDFGLMKALGGSEQAVLAAFVGEAALLGVAAALAGVVFGGLLAGLMSHLLFGLWMLPSLFAALVTLGLTVALASLAALLPWPIVHAATPAAILRGE